ncbi:MAG: DUF72 domain-containing protein [Lysobacteraceae bacterium]|nr:MAG: DUF72 domain-containing protein [Xanthomonadaceae bacterium]
MSARTRAPRVRIGCAGWSIPAQHGHLFHDGPSHLARYATRFDVVEINSTFHRPHRQPTFERWAASVPAGFLFSVKLPRTVTHDARLHGTAGALDAFFESVAGLGTTFGGVLAQLPPSLVFDARVADRFFAMLRRRCDARIACEPRHSSWFEPRVARLWERYAITRVAADPASLADAARTAGSARAGWTYRRWHGSPRMYYSRYADEALRALARELARDGRPRTPAWCILDNTAHGHAIADAARLQAFVAPATAGRLHEPDA